ncbi:hypothetical protein HYC85_014122 [Camellia sinensis]|uniref:CHHC U11-48K-type domain-containing protein n=1 Tax=Camellia sinensis TaxID=4442 RepID=A0A7J7H6N6_CAMSI|nr:hypothetical protein HYC85_014122 [Camellia sinensis]
MTCAKGHVSIITKIVSARELSFVLFQKATAGLYKCGRQAKNGGLPSTKDGLSTTDAWFFALQQKANRAQLSNLSPKVSFKFSNGKKHQTKSCFRHERSVMPLAGLPATQVAGSQDQWPAAKGGGRQVSRFFRLEELWLRGRSLIGLFLDCVGALDGTHVCVKVSSKDAPRYRGRKGITSDSRIIKNALTREDKLKIPNGKFYLVDARNVIAAAIFGCIHNFAILMTLLCPVTRMFTAELEVWEALIELAEIYGKDRAIGVGDIRDVYRILYLTPFRMWPRLFWSVDAKSSQWRDYPIAYSYRVLRIILCSVMAEDCDFLRWVIVNSPRYGVVIDVPMRDHIVLLFQLCLKAIVREATGSVDSVLNRDARELNPAAMSLKCPILVEVLKWLSFQFSVLYGEVNGKLFAIDTLKQWMLNISLNSSLFLLEQKAPESPASRDVDGKSVEPFEKGVEDHADGNSVQPFEKGAEDDVDEPFEKGVEDDGNSVLGESINSRVILVSQVAAAVAALHERALLEEKIKALRSTQSLTISKPGGTAEHAYFSKRADEERQKRPNYRPVLEHDGFLWQRPHNQSTNKAKTREELLAEERDYKRRRMSYRGKKSKRSTTQVMRDIIEEYMDDITQAGGIGCLIKGTEEAGKFTPEPSLHDISSDVDVLRKNVRDSSEISREWSHAYKKQLDSHNNIRSTRFEHVSSEDHKRHRHDSSRHHEHLDTRRRSVERDRCDRDYYSKSPDRRRSHDHSSNREHRNNVELSIKNFSRSSDSGPSRSHGRQTNRRREQSDRNSETKDRRRRHAYRDRRSDSVTSQEFEDRYDPSEFHNMYED